MGGIYVIKAKEIQAQTADAYYPNQIWGGNYCKLQGSSGWLYRTFLQYDLSIIPNNANIQSAKLKCCCKYHNDNGKKGTNNIARVTQAWDGTVLTWNNQPATEGRYLPSNVLPPQTVGEWTDWDITNLVLEWHQGAYPNYGLYIVNNNEGEWRVDWDIWCAKYNESMATYIEITYTLDEDYYLIQDDNSIYSYKSGSLEDLNTFELSSELFLNYGMLEQKPLWEQIKTLINPKVLLWRDSENIVDNLFKITATMKAITSPKILITNKIDLNDTSNVIGIKKVTADSDGDILFAVSFDEKENWLFLNETEWNIASNELEGMNKTRLEAITSEQWAAALGSSKTIYFKAIFSNVEDALRKINIEFLKS